MMPGNKQLITAKSYKTIFFSICKRKKWVLKHHEWCRGCGLGAFIYHLFQHKSYGALEKTNKWQVWNNQNVVLLIACS